MGYFKSHSVPSLARIKVVDRECADIPAAMSCVATCVTERQGPSPGQAVPYSAPAQWPEQLKTAKNPHSSLFLA